MSDPHDKLSRKQVDLVLRRAAEIDSSRRGGGSSDDGDADALSADEIVRLGEEAGLSKDAVDRALAEVRQGAFMEAEPAGALGEIVGPKQLVVTRLVPADQLQTERSVERFMQAQLMTVRRHHGERVEWEKAKGVWPGLARSLDFARRYTFGPVERVETMIVPEGQGASAVAFRVDLGDLRRQTATRMAVRAALPLTLSALWLSAASTAPEMAVALGAGATGVVLFVYRERRRLERLRESVTLGLERFLDLLVQRKRRALKPAPEGALGSAEDSDDVPLRLAEGDGQGS